MSSDNKNKNKILQNDEYEYLNENDDYSSDYEYKQKIQNEHDTHIDLAIKIQNILIEYVSTETYCNNLCEFLSNKDIEHLLNLLN